jgi:hypothetical protein
MDAQNQAGPGNLSEMAKASKTAIAESAALRAATWEESPPEQKFERLRLEIRLLRDLVNSQQELISRLVFHSHAPDGSIVVPFKNSGLTGTSVAAGRMDQLR